MMKKDIELELNLDNFRLNINLELYRTIKEVVQIKLSNEQNISIIEKLKLIIDSDDSFEKKLDNFLASLENIAKKQSRKEDILNFISNVILEERSFRILKLSLNLVRFKDFILEKSKILSENFRATENIHIMDFSYDYNMLLLPYSVRVSGALLIKVLFEEIEKSTNSIYEPIKSDLAKMEKLDPDTILQIIYAESASQSIRSTSGSSYETRFEEILKANGIDYKTKSHDSIINAVEYDFMLLVDNKKIGVSAKRTLRERYKQNHEDVDSLEIDAMFLITLGIDLNEEKVKNIIQKKGHFIFVASDIFEKKEYMKKENKVFPINELNNELIRSLFEEKK